MLLFRFRLLTGFQTFRVLSNIFTLLSLLSANVFFVDKDGAGSLSLVEEWRKGECLFSSHSLRRTVP